MADWKKTFRIHVCCSVLVLAFLVSVPLLAATAAVEAKDEAAAEPALQKDPLGRLPSSPEEARERLANREIGWPDYGCEGGFEAAAMTAGVQRGVRVAIPYNSVEGSVDTAGADVKLELWRGGAKLGEKAVKAGADGWFKADLSDIGGGIRSGDVVKVTDLGAGPTVDIDCTLTANIDFANNRVTGNTLAGYAVDAYIIAPSTYYADLPPGAARRIGVSPAAGGAYTAEITDLDLRRGDAAFVFATNPATGHRVMNAAAGSGAGLVVYPQYNDVMGFYVPGTQLLVRADSAHRNVDTMQDGFFVAMFYDFNISAGTRVSCDMGGTREVIVRDVTARCDPGDNKVHLTTPANRDVRLTMDPYIDPVIYQIPRWQNPTGNIVVELGERFTATGTEVFNVTWYDDDGDAVVYEFQTFSWYLAEGYTGGEFDTWVLVQNPGSKDAAVSVTFQLPPGQWAPPLTFIVGPETRASIHLNELPGLGATDVSTKVTSTTGAWIMAERAVYFDYYGKQGGHNSIGTITPSRTWYLAEGYTGGDFDTWVLAQNPGTQDAVVTLDFQLPPGQSAPSFAFELPAGTRRSIPLNALPGLEATDVSTKVTATRPVVAERAMYFTYDGKQGGHDSIGVTAPAETWYLAEGYTGGEFDTWVLVQNPGTQSAVVTLDFQLPPEQFAVPFVFELPAGTRKSILLNEVPGLEETDVATKVTATEPVVAERAMYFTYDGKSGGHDSIGTTQPGTTWYLAEGYTGGEFDTWVLVQNPGVHNAVVILEFQLPVGRSAAPFSFVLPAGSRKSILLNSLPGLEATDVSTRVTSSQPVVAERAMYFTYDGKSGGHDSIGIPEILP